MSLSFSVMCHHYHKKIHIYKDFVNPCVAYSIFPLDIKVKEQSIENILRNRKVFEPPRFMRTDQAAQQLLDTLDNRLQQCSEGEEQDLSEQLANVVSTSEEGSATT